MCRCLPEGSFPTYRSVFLWQESGGSLIPIEGSFLIYRYKVRKLWAVRLRELGQQITSDEQIRLLGTASSVDGKALLNHNVIPRDVPATIR